MRGLVAVALVFLMLAGGACGSRQPLPQPRKVADPADVPGAVLLDAWELAAVEYAYPGQGLDYTEAGLQPVYLVLENKGEGSPQVLVSEVRGVAPDGEYLPYSVDEAQRLIYDSEAFGRMAQGAARRGALGAAAGAGLGALLGLIGGGDNIWKGAAIGGGIGGLAGAGSSVAGQGEELRRDIETELRQYAWTDEPVPPSFTKVGYVYLPGKVGIERIKVTLREGGELKTYTLPLADVRTRTEN